MMYSLQRQAEKDAPLYYPVTDDRVEDTAAPVPSRGFHEGKSQISNQLTAA